MNDLNYNERISILGFSLSFSIKITLKRLDDFFNNGS